MAVKWQLFLLFLLRVNCRESARKIRLNYFAECDAAKFVWFLFAQAVLNPAVLSRGFVSDSLVIFSASRWS